MQAQLTPPSVELAGKILREVGWEEKLEGRSCDSGSGDMSEYVYQIKHAYNLLQSDVFRLDLRKLQQWVGEVLGDEEVAAEIGALLETMPDGDETEIWNRVWSASDAEAQAEAQRLAQDQAAALTAGRTHVREGIIRLLGVRIAQCTAILGRSATEDGFSADHGGSTSSATKRQTPGS